MVSVYEKVLSNKAVAVLLSDVVVKENIIDPVFEISSGSAKGDGYTSFMTKVNIIGSNKVLPLIIKSAPKISKMRDILPTRVMFTQEMKYYEEIFPAFKKFQNERGVVHPFNSVPICYKTINLMDNELLVLENIKEKAFNVFDKRKQMDQTHVEMVLRLYGELHAISFSMKEYDIKRFNELTKDIEYPFSTKHFKDDFFEMFKHGVDKMKSVFDENIESDIRKRISRLRDETIPFFTILQSYTGKYGVLTHGDCWCNNMMFQYEGENSTTPTDMRLFDFQMGTLTSPVLDIAYFFYVSASQDMLDNIDYYLKVYHDSLRKHMVQMGSDVDKHYPILALKEEWKIFGKYGLFLAVCIYRVMLRDDDEILDFTDETESIKDTFMKDSKYDHLINERYRRLGLHFYKNNLI